MEVKVNMLPVFVQEAQGKEETDRLADDRREGGAEGAQPGRPDQQDIQNHVDDRGKSDEQEGMLRVAHAAQNGGNQVIAVDERDPEDTGDAVLPGIFPDVIGSIQPAQDSLIAEEKDDHDDESQAFEQREERADHLTHQVVPSAADITGDQDLPGIGKAHGHEGDQHQDFAADGDRGEASRADKLAYDDHVDHVVDHLEQTGKEQGQGKTDQRFRNAAGGQIADDPVLLFHTAAPFLSVGFPTGHGTITGTPKAICRGRSAVRSQIGKSEADQGSKILRVHADLETDTAGADKDLFLPLRGFVNKGREDLFHPQRGAAAVNVAGQGQKILLAYHGNGFFAGGFRGLFQVQLLLYGDHEDIMASGFPFGNQSLVDLARVFIQEKSDFFAGHGRVRLIAAGGVGDFSAVQQTHDVGFFGFHSGIPFKK